MNRVRFVTAGESHGQGLITWLSGLPAGLSVDFEFVNRELHRRQLGYGRGGRQKIEKDAVEALAGVRHGRTIGAPIALRLENREWETRWKQALPVEDFEGSEQARKPLTAPRPGHADLAGALKFDLHDARYVLERASARETAARTAAGAFAKLLLRQFGIEILATWSRSATRAWNGRQLGKKSRPFARTWNRLCAALIRKSKPR